MAIPRPPTSSGAITTQRMGTRTYAYGPLGGAQAPLTKTTTTDLWNDVVDYRSAYVKGAVVTLIGGNTFRKATSYSRENWEVGEASGIASASGVYLGRYYTATDDGFSGDVFLNGETIFGTRIPSDAQSEALTKALNQIGDQKANLGEALGTLGQTIRLFTKPVLAATQLAEAVERKGFKRYALRSFRQLLRDGIPTRIAEKYLEYIYGFAPLMSDAYGLYEFSKQVSTRDMLLSGHGSASRSSSKPDRPVSASHAEIYRKQQIGTAKVKSHLWAQLDPEWGGLRAWNQLGLLNPVNTAWELVPWSFVVDWLVPIGPVLSALSAPAGLRFVNGTTSVRSSESSLIEYWIRSGAINRQRMPNSTPLFFPVTYEGYSRAVHTTWPRPGFYVDRDPLRASRPFAALALSLTALSGKRNDIGRIG